MLFKHTYGCQMYMYSFLCTYFWKLHLGFELSWYWILGSHNCLCIISTQKFSTDCKAMKQSFMYIWVISFIHEACISSLQFGTLWWGHKICNHYSNWWGSTVQVLAYFLLNWLHTFYWNFIEMSILHRKYI